MLARFGCCKAASSCVIGNILAEISPPCNNCGNDDISITGTTATGSTITIYITKEGFDIEGSAADIELVERIRRERCIHGEERKSGIWSDSKG